MTGQNKQKIFTDKFLQYDIDTLPVGFILILREEADSYEITHLIQFLR